MHSDQLDIDFTKICKNKNKIIKEIRELLFNDNETDVDSIKIKKIFVNGKKYVNTNQEVKDFPADNDKK